MKDKSRKFVVPGKLILNESSTTELHQSSFLLPSGNGSGPGHVCDGLITGRATW